MRSKAPATATRISVDITRSSRHAQAPVRCCTSAPAKARRTRRAARCRFIEELIPRVARAGAIGPKLLRADSGFWNTKIDGPSSGCGLDLFDRGAPANPTSRRRSRRSPETDWQPLCLTTPKTGEAQIAADNARLTND